MAEEFHRKERERERETGTRFDRAGICIKVGLYYVETIPTTEWTPPPSGERCFSINATKLIKRQNVDSSPVH